MVSVLPIRYLRDEVLAIGRVQAAGSAVLARADTSGHEWVAPCVISVESAVSRQSQLFRELCLIVSV
jgi:hypothetical protein